MVKWKNRQNRSSALGLQISPDPVQVLVDPGVDTGPAVAALRWSKRHDANQVPGLKLSGSVDEGASGVALTRVGILGTRADDLEILRSSSELQEALPVVRDGHLHLLDDGRHESGGLEEIQGELASSKFKDSNCSISWPNSPGYL